jgi:glycosyltransferase involved in cell wall biosynthesis
MKFSISTSFYKRSDKVQHLYQQILDQTYTNWEWIVTDDFSEENNAEQSLKEICAKDPRVKYYHQSRKKECFYNPQRGASGDIIVMLDSDDYAFPKLLEIYHNFLSKHPEVMGISCLSQTIDGNGEFVEIQGGGNFKTGDAPTFNYTPMSRAFRNIYPEFDNGVMKWYQNDTNIVRHMEYLGKWFYLPRILCEYYYSPDTVSRALRPDEEWVDIERERLFIESKFPTLHQQDICSQFLYFISIEDIARDFSLGEFNKTTSKNNILYINSDLKLYEKQLLKELFFDQSLYFDYNLDKKFDEIIVSLNSSTCENLPQITQVLLETNKDTHIKFKLNLKTNPNVDEIHQLISSLYGSYGWLSCGYEIYFITAV